MSCRVELMITLKPDIAMVTITSTLDHSVSDSSITCELFIRWVEWVKFMITLKPNSAMALPNSYINSLDSDNRIYSRMFTRGVEWV